MSPTFCRSEPDVLDVVAVGQWPARASDSLQTHVAGCRICSDIVAAAGAIRELADEPAGLHPRLPDAAAVWHLARARTRADLARRAAWPVAMAAAAAAASIVLVSAAAWSRGAEWIAAWWQALPRPSAGGVLFPERLTTAGEAVALWTWVGAAVLAWIAAVPAGLFLARLVDRAGPLEPSRRV